MVVRGGCAGGRGEGGVLVGPRGCSRIDSSLGRRVQYCNFTNLKTAMDDGTYM